MKEKFGEKLIKFLKTEKPMSMTQIAKKLGVRRDVLSGYLKCLMDE